jgi:hypothetical protein
MGCGDALTGLREKWGTLTIAPPSRLQGDFDHNHFKFAEIFFIFYQRIGAGIRGASGPARKKSRKKRSGASAPLRLNRPSAFIYSTAIAPKHMPVLAFCVEQEFFRA